MSGELLDEKSFEPYEGNEVRSSVARKVKYLRNKFRLIPMQIKRYNRRLADDLRTKWEEENKNYRKNHERETPPQRLKRWKDMSRRYRSYSLMELSNRFYKQFRKLRSEMALIVAMYQFSEIDTIPKQQMDWKEQILDEFDSLILRMRGPRKPSKKNYGMKDLKYDVGDAFLLMVQDLEDWAKETKKMLDSLTAPRKKMKYKTKVKRFKNAVKTREYLTVLCQSLAPRKKGIQLLRDIDKLDAEEYHWVAVFEED